MSLWWWDHEVRHTGILLSADCPFIKGCKPIAVGPRQTN
ncbi:hypothetical protein [Arthrobacter oryzae]|nr:hypothetical protein [Arthrobacter oryzae]WLQ05712.1 hypothetical protein Q8Z05_16580 [Arthrobacter oryzae]